MFPYSTPTENSWETSVILAAFWKVCAQKQRVSSLWCISREQKCAGWWLNRVQTALDLSELPTGNSSFLIQMNFCICVILPSTTSIALGQFYSLWKQKVRKEAWSAKCTDGNTRIYNIYCPNHIFFSPPTGFHILSLWEELKRRQNLTQSLRIYFTHVIYNIVRGGI